MQELEAVNISQHKATHRQRPLQPYNRQARRREQTAAGEGRGIWSRRGNLCISREEGLSCEPKENLVTGGAAHGDPVSGLWDMRFPDVPRIRYTFEPICNPFLSIMSSLK